MSKKTLLYSLGSIVAGGVATLCLLLISTKPPSSMTVRRGSSPYYSESITVAPGTGLFFTWGVTPSPRAKAIGRGEALNEKDRYGNTYDQARALMTQLTEDLREAGLSLRDVISVRANLVAEPELDMDGWNRAFSEFFGTATNPHRPVRTTVGISRLFHPDYLAEVEFIAAIPPGRGPFEKGSRFERLYDRLKRSGNTPAMRAYGRPTWVLATGKAVAPGSALYFQSALFPEPMMPKMLEMPVKMRMYKGDVATQADGIFKKHVAGLKEAGLAPSDTVFLRTVLYPDLKNGGRLDFSGFNGVYSQIYNTSENPNRAARTIMSAPGYATQGQLMTMEAYAVYPTPEASPFPSDSSLPLKSFRTDPKALAASGVATSPKAALTWLSGIVAPERTDLKTESLAVLKIAHERLSTAKAGLEHVVQLRAYLVTGSDMPGGVSAFESAYSETFKGDHRPALTVLPVKALANGAKVEIELLAATLP
ncbi:MAG TPA: RidA family protein [Opitutaceae bacterium]|nr:RidA family protein [Opitutaceae bacterium]